MKCSVCGAEIEEGKLLCESCGSEIQIVPDFVPEVENSITQSLSDVVQAINDAEVASVNEAKAKKMLIPLAGATILILVLFFVIFSYYRSTVAYHMNQASKAVNEKRYEDALGYLEEALNAGAEYEEVRMSEALIYQYQGDDENYLSVLLGLLKENNISQSTVLEVYDRLVDYYSEKEEYEQLNALLLNCPDQGIRSQYTEYTADAPIFNYVEGSYNVIVPLKIMGNTSGSIYYTMDGSAPDKNSKEYTEPIFLETGDYEITAVFINKYGIVSPYARASYHVDVTMPDAPEVDTYSGVYYVPALIHAQAREDCDIYYTSDGSDPTAMSSLYNGFLTIPLGESTFKFIAVDSTGLSSEIITRTYVLELLTDHTVDEARTVIMKYLRDSGQASDSEGTLTEDPSRKKYYQFACCVHMEEDGDFYIFSEYIRNSDGSSEKTGGYYAVGVYNLPLYGTRYSGVAGSFILSTEQLADGLQIR